MNELNILSTQTGLTMSAIPYLGGVAQPAIAIPEIGTTMAYQGDMAGPAGSYELILFVSTEGGVVTNRGYGRIKWNGTQEIPWEAEGIAEQVRTELATELAAIGEIPTAAETAEAVMRYER